MPIEETLKDLKDLAAQQKQLQALPHQSGVCPSCGYCPHCGRGQQLGPYYPQPYYQPPNYWWYQPWSGETHTITCGTSPISGNVSSITNAALVQGHISYTSGTCSQS